MTNLLTIQHLGYQATAFEKWGFIDFEDFKANEIMEVLDTLSDDEIINLYNEFLSSNSDEQYFINDDDFNQSGEEISKSSFRNKRIKG